MCLLLHKAGQQESSLRCQVGLCANSRLGGEPCVTATSCLLSVQRLGLYALSLGSNALQARATLRYFCLIKRCRCFWVVCAHTKRSWPLIFGMQRYTESKALFSILALIVISFQACFSLPGVLVHSTGVIGDVDGVPASREAYLPNA